MVSDASRTVYEAYDGEVFGEMGRKEGLRGRREATY